MYIVLDHTRSVLMTVTDGCLPANVGGGGNVRNILRRVFSILEKNGWWEKLSIEKDYDLVVGKKSLFHSFRIITYGIQLAEAGKITNYQACNELFYEITHNYNTWSELFKAYKNKYNNLKSEFRILAPK